MVCSLQVGGESKMKGGKTYEEMLASRTPESQKRIWEGTERLREAYQTTCIQSDFGLSRTESEAPAGVSLPVLSKMKKKMPVEKSPMKS